MERCFYCTTDYKEYMKDIAILPYSRVYLHNEQEYPGRCIVVFKDHKKELFELSGTELNGYMKDVACVANAVNLAFKPDKINYAVYGDIDSHIHFHIVPKHKGCKFWGMPFEICALDTPAKYLSINEYEDYIGKIRSFLPEEV